MPMKPINFTLLTQILQLLTHIVNKHSKTKWLGRKMQQKKGWHLQQIPAMPFSDVVFIQVQLFYPNTARILNKHYHFDLNNNHHQAQHPNKPKTWEEIIQTLEILHAIPQMKWLQSNLLHFSGMTLFVSLCKQVDHMLGLHLSTTN